MKDRWKVPLAVLSVAGLTATMVVVLLVHTLPAAAQDSCSGVQVNPVRPTARRLLANRRVAVRYSPSELIAYSSPIASMCPLCNERTWQMSSALRKGGCGP